MLEFSLRFDQRLTLLEKKFEKLKDDVLPKRLIKLKDDIDDKLKLHMAQSKNETKKKLEQVMKQIHDENKQFKVFAAKYEKFKEQTTKRISDLETH